MIGYKIAKNGKTLVIVTLHIPSNARTNMGRSSVAFPETAKYRTDKATVVEIKDAAGVSYTSAISFSYNQKSLTYTVGKTLEEPTFNPDIEKVCAEGIHYFLSRRVAELYELEKIENGLHQKWYDNGQMAEECTFIGGKSHGPYRKWYENGQKHVDATYVDDTPNGLCQVWYDNGQKFQEKTFRAGKIHGLCQIWHDNGHKFVEGTFVDGTHHGLYQSWHFNGTKSMETTFVNGQSHGLYQEWYSNGQKAIEATFLNGKIYGLYQCWDFNGKLLKETTCVNSVIVSAAEYTDKH